MNINRKVAGARRSDLNQFNSILIRTCALALFVAPTISAAQAQQSSMPPSVGQISTAPSASSGAGTTSSSMSSPISNSTTNTSSMTNNFNPAARLTPTNTTGNTPSALGIGAQSSGYSAGGSTVNSNINSTQTAIRGAGQPVGGGSQTTQPYGGRSRSNF
jgi:hypothetical protein